MKLIDIIGYSIDFGKYIALPVALWLVYKSILEVYEVITIRTRLDQGDDE